MFFAIFRLFSIFIAVLTTLVGIVFGLRQLGHQTTITKLNHPLLLQTPWVIADGGELSAGPEQSLPALVAAAKKVHPQYFIGLHLRQSSDGQWVLYSPSHLEKLTTGKGFVPHHTLAELKSLNFKNTTETLLTVDEAFAALPGQQFFIEVLQPANPNLEKIFSLIERYNLKDKVILTSPFADTLREIRNKNGLWLTGTSTSELGKARFLTSMFLETTMDLPGDVFKANLITHQRLIAELLRRNKIVLFEDERDKMSSDEFISKIELISQPKQKAILTTRPTNYLQLVDGAPESH